jgi:hypothetical protein
VTDFLIRPRDLREQGTLPGDSGTLWFWEQWRNKGAKNEALVALRPFAMQWGGHNWVDSGQCLRVGRFALASALSTICRELDVTLLRDWNAALPEYWGPVGHYTIAFFACEGLGGKLGTLMKANQFVISYPEDSIKVHSKITKKAAGGLVPLADVPDRIWAHGLTVRGSADNPNHFADMDTPDPAQGNKTLLQLCQDESNINPSFWIQYYANVGDSSRGCLPFRVWQFFDEMVDAIKQGDADRFVAAAGIMAHYVGDACQPLHISHLFNGEPMPNGTKRGEGVHSAYEEDMLRQNAADVLTGIRNELQKSAPAIPTPVTGKQAAVQIVRLMQRTFGDDQAAGHRGRVCRWTGSLADLRAQDAAGDGGRSSNAQGHLEGRVESGEGRREDQAVAPHGGGPPEADHDVHEQELDAVEKLEDDWRAAAVTVACRNAAACDDTRDAKRSIDFYQAVRAPRAGAHFTASGVAVPLGGLMVRIRESYSGSGQFRCANVPGRSRPLPSPAR